MQCVEGSEEGKWIEQQANIKVCQQSGKSVTETL
jgi:hypothetical protein